MSAVLTRGVITIAISIVCATPAAPIAVAQSRVERRTAALEARISAEPETFQHYLDLAKHHADNRQWLDARATVVRAINRLGLRVALGPSVWRAPWLTGSEPPPVAIGGSIRPPMKIRDVRSVYSADAQAERASGVVILDVVIGRNGRVEELGVRRSDHPALEASAMASVSQWQYEPTVHDGETVRVAMPVVVTFTLQTLKPAPDAGLVDAVRRRPDDWKARLRLAEYYAERNHAADLMRALLGLRDALGRQPSR